MLTTYTMEMANPEMIQSQVNSEDNVNKLTLILNDLEEKIKKEATDADSQPLGFDTRIENKHGVGEIQVWL